MWGFGGLDMCGVCWLGCAILFSGSAFEFLFGSLAVLLIHSLAELGACMISVRLSSTSWKGKGYGELLIEVKDDDAILLVTH